MRFCGEPSHSPLLALPGIAGESAIMAGIGNGKRTLATCASLPRAGSRGKARQRLLSRAGADEISSALSMPVDDP
jgi:hypothetical protein